MTETSGLAFMLTHRLLRLPWLGVMIAALFLTASCNSKQPLQIDPSGARSHLEVRMQSLNGDAVVEVLAPTAGWQVRFDGDRRDQNDFAIFITMTRPEPKYVHAEVITKHHVGTNVRSGEPVAVYVRVLEFGEDPVESKKLYRPARILGDDEP